VCVHRVVSACCPISKVKGEVELELGVGKKVLVFVLVVLGSEWSVGNKLLFKKGGGQEGRELC
jgi:hypothetical protein